MLHAAGRGTPLGPRRQSSLLGAAGGGTILRQSMTGSPRRALLLGTPQSEPGTPSAQGQAQPEPEPESGPSPIGDTDETPVYVFEKLPLLTDCFHSMNGTVLIKQAIRHGGGGSLWSSDMKAEISTVVDEYLPGIMTAQERIEDADEADAESLEAAKTAMIVEYVDELERRLQTTVDNVMAESTESVFLKTLAPALQGHMSAVATELSKANIVSDDAAEEAAVQAAMNEAVNDKQAVEDRRYTRVMTTLSKLCKQLVDTETAKTTEAKHHAEHMVKYTAAMADTSADGMAKADAIQKQMDDSAKRISSLETVLETYKEDIRRLLVDEYPIAETVQGERRLQDGKLKLKELNLLNDPHPSKARKLLDAVWNMCKDFPLQLFAIVPIIYRMTMDNDILYPHEPYNRENCKQYMEPAMARYYMQHTELLYQKMQEADDRVTTKAAIKRKTGEDGFEPRESEGFRHCGVSCVSGLRHEHEKDGLQVIINFREIIHSQWPLFMKEDNIKKLCEDMRKLVQEARELRIEISYAPTIYSITQILRKRSTALYNHLEKWLHFTEDDKHDCIEKLDAFLTDVEHIISRADGPLDRVQDTVHARAVNGYRALFDDDLQARRASAAGSSSGSEWI